MNLFKFRFLIERKIRKIKNMTNINDISGVLKFLGDKNMEIRKYVVFELCNISKSKRYITKLADCRYFIVNYKMLSGFCELSDSHQISIIFLLLTAYQDQEFSIRKTSRDCLLELDDIVNKISLVLREKIYMDSSLIEFISKIFIEFGDHAVRPLLSIALDESAPSSSHDIANNALSKIKSLLVADIIFSCNHSFSSNLAVSILDNLGHPSSEMLIKYLNDTSLSISKHLCAIKILGKRREKKGVEILSKYINNIIIGGDAAIALGEIGDPSILHLLIAYYDKFHERSQMDGPGQYTRSECCLWFDNYKKICIGITKIILNASNEKMEVIVDYLIDCLNESNSYFIRRMAVNLLGKAKIDNKTGKSVTLASYAQGGVNVVVKKLEEIKNDFHIGDDVKKSLSNITSPQEILKNIIMFFT